MSPTIDAAVAHGRRGAKAELGVDTSTSLAVGQATGHRACRPGRRRTPRRRQSPPWPRSRAPSAVNFHSTSSFSGSVLSATPVASASPRKRGQSGRGRQRRSPARSADAAATAAIVHAERDANAATRRCGSDQRLAGSACRMRQSLFIRVIGTAIRFRTRLRTVPTAPLHPPYAD